MPIRLIRFALPVLCFACSFADVAEHHVMVPDFTNKTLQQVQTAAIDKATNKSIFAAIDTQGPADGIVSAQTPKPNTLVVPGSSRLALTMTKRPSLLDNILQAIQNAQPAKTTVPYLIGNSAAEATQKLQTAHLRASFHNGQSGIVSYQSLPANSLVAVNTAVSLTLTPPQQPTANDDTPLANDGHPIPDAVAPKMVTVPRVLGLTLAQAKAKISAASLTTGTITNAEPQANIVSVQVPAPDSSVAEHSAVDLTLRRQNSVPTVPQVSVPDLQGASLSEARMTLSRFGLRLGDVTGSNTGKVTEQAPAANVSVERGSAVSVKLGTPTVTIINPPPSPPPPVWILLIAAAALLAAGGIWLGVKWIWPPAPVVCGFVPHPATPQVRLNTQGSGIRFALSFHGSATTPVYGIRNQPTVFSTKVKP